MNAPLERGAVLTRLVLGALSLCAIAPSSALAQEPSDDWTFSATVYGWFPDIGGHTDFPAGAGGTIDVDIGTILDHLKMTAQGSFELHKGKWGAYTDIVYLNVGEATSQTRNLEIGGQPLPAAVTADVDFDLKSTIGTFAGSYRVVDGPGTTFDVLLGARVASFDQDLDWEFTGNFGPVTPPPLTGSRGASAEQWDGIIGARGRLTFGGDAKWLVPYHFDIGAGDSDLTWQAMVGLAYAFGWGDLGVAWRHLDYDLGSNGPIADLNFSGPALGAAFRW
jgi:hypothetical protein